MKWSLLSCYWTVHQTNKKIKDGFFRASSFISVTQTPTSLGVYRYIVWQQILEPAIWVKMFDGNRKGMIPWTKKNCSLIVVFSVCQVWYLFCNLDTVRCTKCRQQCSKLYFIEKHWQATWDKHAIWSSHTWNWLEMFCQMTRPERATLSILTLLVDRSYLLSLGYESWETGWHESGHNHKSLKNKNVIWHASV